MNARGGTSPRGSVNARGTRVGVRRALSVVGLVAVAVAVATQGATGSAAPLDVKLYAHERAIDAPAGWMRLTLPDDVLDASRAGLADVRVTADGNEIAYTAGALPNAAPTWPVMNVEHSPGVATTAVVDRGEHAVPIDAISIDVGDAGSTNGDSAGFLKPVVVEASPDGKHYKEIVRGSIFAVPSPATRMTTLRFAANDRRYLQLRLDDRDGPVVPFSTITGHVAAPSAAGATPPPREIRVPAVPGASTTFDVTTYVVNLPAAHLSLASLEIESPEPAFARQVKVYDRVIDRDEISRRLIGASRVVRGAGEDTVTETTISSSAGRMLEIEVAKASGLPLTVSGFVVRVVPTSIVFYAPGAQRLSLRYGSERAEPPHYDLSEAFARRAPTSLGEAYLDAESGGATSTTAVVPVVPGAVLDASGWASRRTVTPTDPGGLAYVALSDLPDQLASYRIIDDQNRQIPYIVEHEPRLHSDAATFTATSKDRRTTLAITGYDANRTIDAIELSARTVPYFVRQIAVFEESTDPRGRTSQRELGGARWERAMNAPAQPLRLAIAQPHERELRVTIDDGDNPALPIDAVTVEQVDRRLDFVAPPAQKALTLLSDNPKIGPPEYDLALVAERIASSPAREASLGPMVTTPTTTVAAGSMRWLWGAVLLAAVGVVFALARTLRGPVS